MNDRDRKWVYVGASLLITIMIHMLLWQAAARIRFRSFYGSPAADQRNIQVKSIDLADLTHENADNSRQLNREIMVETEEILDRFLTRESVSRTPAPMFDPGSAKLTRKTAEQLSRDTVPLQRPSSHPADILKIDGDTLSKERLEAQRRRIPKIKRIPGRTELPPTSIINGDVTGAYRRIDSKTNTAPRRRSQRDILPKPSGASPAFENRLPTFPEVSPEVVKTAEVPRKIKSLDSALDTSIRVYRDEDRGTIYFQVEILPNESAASIEPIPKDVLFLVDSSNSIAFEKLREFRKGLRLAMKYLAAGDNYNVVAFRDRASPLFPSLTPRSEFNLQLADEFVNDLKSSGKTDLYSSLAPFVKATRKNRLRPYLIFLISDGNTTTGVKLEDNELIRKVMKDNLSNGSIFGFSAGEESNRFLMDFLSYTNRGFSVHAKKIEKSHQELLQLIQGLREVLVVDLSCNISGTGAPEIFPKNLPHLFRNRPLYVYGKANAGTREIALRVVGRSKKHKTEELITRLDLESAAAGGPELAHRWASQKVYHLMGQIIEHRRPELRKKMRSLATEFKIELPR